MLTFRKLHLFLGTFFAPAIIFFALSGLLQVVGLHESKEKGAPPPVAWIAKLAQIHKDQQLRPLRKPGAVAHADHDAKAPVVTEPHAHAEAKPESFVPLKLFVLLMALGLMASSLIGMYIAVQNPRTRRGAWFAIVLGTILPLLLLTL